MSRHADWKPPTAGCPYCGATGKVYAGSPPVDRRCLGCDGTGRVLAALCPICGEPLLDHQSKIYSINGVSVTTDHRPVHLACLPDNGEEPGQ